jgi:iron complex outermembrane receptor protein
MGKENSMKTKFVATLLAGSALVPVFGAAQAQAVSAAAPVVQPAAAADPVQDDAAAAAATDGAAEGAVEDIVVTGSRVARAGYSAPTPVTMLQTESLAAKAPSNLSDALNQLPVFTGSISNGQDRGTNAGRVRTGNYLNLRSLGSQRVLVLQDGLRLPPTGNAGGTDANMIPQLLIERVDVVTGGASAAYGSDAVSGVVNFVLDKKFTGVKMLAQAGISDRGDSGSTRIGAAYGESFLDDRLHVIASAERYHSDGIRLKSSRAGVNENYAVIGSGTAADPFVNASNVRFSAVTDGGYILDGPLRGQQFLANGRVGAFNAGTPTGRAGLAYGGEGAVFPASKSTLSAAATTEQFLGRISYDFGGGISAYVQGSYNHAVNSDSPQPVTRSASTTGVRIFAENAYLNPADRALLGSTPSFGLTRFFSDFPFYSAKQETRATIVNSGVKGEIGSSGFKWDVNYTYGRTRLDSSALDLDMSRFYAAVDAVRNPAGQIVCRITVTNPGLQDGCVALNILGAGNASQAGIDYVMGVSKWRAINKMHDVEGSISGEPFSTWAGPVSVVVGGGYRHQSLDQTSNSNPATPPSFTGIRGVPTNTGAYSFTNVSFASGSYSIKEAFGEVVVPLAKDSVIGESLELNGAFRYTDYSTSGSVQTWKLGGTYEPGAGLKARVTVSRDIRAPTLYELYAGPSLRVQSYSDKLTNQLAQYNEVNQGNTNLKPEIGSTLTAGLVFQPRFLPGFAISADYYRIRIRDAIASQYTSVQVLDLCALSNYTSPICSQVIRPLGPTNTSTANFPSQVNIFQANVASTRTEGLDLEASYRTPLFDGTLSTRLLATRLISYTTRGSATAAAVEYAGNADFADSGNQPFPMPKWRGNLDLSYAQGGLTVSGQARYIGGYKRSDLFVYKQNHVGAVAYVDLNISYDIKSSYGTFQLFTTINNLFDRGYPITAIGSNPGLAVSTFRSIYDVTGRYITTGVRLRF